MLRLLRWLVTGDGHAHRYEIQRQLSVYRKENPDLVEGFTYITRCSICGKLTSYNVGKVHGRIYPGK